MISNYMANMMIKPHQSPVFDNPKNFGLDYHDVTFIAADGITLSGWLIKGSEDNVIIQSHFGVHCCRSGFTLQGKGLVKGFPQDIHFLNQAKYLNVAGYTVLMYDFRNHGNSELGTNPWVTWGLEESKDVIAAVDFISKHSDYK
ncbi:alpha/beta hydrolase, partial [bacterium]|nr:alpha/beta hydrolase [bacterium]